MAKTNILHKPHELIFYKPKDRQKLTALTRLLYNGIVLFTQWQLHDEKVDPSRWFSCPLIDLLDMIGLTQGEGKYDYRTVKKHIQEIRTFNIEWRFNDENNNLRERGIGLIDKFEFAHINKSIIFSWQMDENVQSLLQRPENLYARIDLELISKLRSGASIALYEICRRYMTNKFGHAEGFTASYDLDWWVLTLTGNPQAHPQYKAFKRDTLLPALDEVNNLEGGEFTVRMEELFKPGMRRRVVGLKFHIKEKVRANAPSLESTSFENRLKALNLNSKQVLKLISKYQDNPQYLEKHLAGAEFAMAKNLIKKTTAGWLYKALEEDFSYEKNVSNIPTHSSQKPFENQNELQAQPLVKEIPISPAAKDAYEQYLKLDPQAQEVLYEKYLMSIKPDLLELMKKKGGLERDSYGFQSFLASKMDEQRALMIYEQFDEGQKLKLKENYLKSYSFNRHVFDDQFTNAQVRKTFTLWLVKNGYVPKQPL